MQKNFEEYPKYLFHEGTNIEADKLFCPKKAVIDGKEYGRQMPATYPWLAISTPGKSVRRR